MKKKVIDIQPPTVPNENELVADAHEHCSHAAPPCCTESRSQSGTLCRGKVCLDAGTIDAPIRLRGYGVFWCALLTSIVRPTPSDECDTTLAETLSSTHGLKDFSSI